MNRTKRILLGTSVALLLAVPVRGALAEAAPATTPTTTATSTTITVSGGDSLAGIAYRYSIRLSVLLRANSMTITTVIHPGDTLIIPAGASIRAAANAVSSTIPPATMPIPTPRGAATPATASTSAAGPASAVVARSATGSLDALVTYLIAQVGTPYQFFSAGPATFDCSGLVVAGFRQIGMSMPHQSRALARLGTPVDWRNGSIAAGDLVFTSAVNDPTLITHVGVALDSRRWVHAVGVGRTVTIGSLPTSDRIMAVRRIALR